MFESMYAAKGVGLAAPQIGIAKRIAVIDVTSGEDPAQKIVLINPEVMRCRARRQAKKDASAFPRFASRSPARKR